MNKEMNITEEAIVEEPIDLEITPDMVVEEQNEGIVIPECQREPKEDTSRMLFKEPKNAAEYSSMLNNDKYAPAPEVTYAKDEKLSPEKEAVLKAYIKERERIKKETVEKWDKKLLASPDVVKVMKAVAPSISVETSNNCEELELNTKAYIPEYTEDVKEIRKEIDAYKQYKENVNKPSTFSGILDEMDKLHSKKNSDYGNVWHREIAEFGALPGVIRLWEKVERLKALNKAGRAQVTDESFEDTLLDIANYAVMTLVELRNLNK